MTKPSLNKLGRPDRSRPFWRYKSLEEMTPKEWESLCDGCGRCCLNKFEDEDSSVHFTDVACQLLDLDTCRCQDYSNRRTLVPDCTKLTPRRVARMNCLPKTCAYRLIHEGKELKDWHPLVSKSSQSVHEAGISVRGRVVAENGLTDEEIEDRLIDWPDL